MPRALLIVLDSAGIGGAEDAHVYGTDLPLRNAVTTIGIDPRVARPMNIA